VSGVLTALPASTPPAGAATVSLIKDVIVSAPPSGNFAGASTGDGWDVMFYRDRIFNIFHHGSSFNVDCHLQTDGSHCDTVDTISPWPKTVTSADPVSDFTSPAHSSGWIDQDTGHLYGWGSRIADATGGVICVDLTSPSDNPSCGFTPLTAAGVHDEGGTTAFGGRAVIGSEMFAYDPKLQQVLCFSTATDTACPNQPFAIALGGITAATDGWTDNSTLAAGGKVFIHAEDEALSGGVLTCFDAQSHATCAGTWPQVISGAVSAPSSVGAAFPYLSANGTVIGACMPYVDLVPCWDLSGSVITTPAALIGAIGHTDMWNEGTTFGTRVFVATGEAVEGTIDDGVFCYDFATGANCPNFPIETGKTTYLYSVSPDPVRTGCMWINANSSNGANQIRTFDGFDGTSGCSDRVHVKSSVVIPDSNCNALGWTGVQVLDPARSGYSDASLSLTNVAGDPVAGGTDLAVDGAGNFDLSALTIPDSVLFTATFTAPTFSQTGVIFRFTWDSTSDNNCEDNATTVPDAPAITSLTADPSSGGLDVAFTPPADHGTAPITSYTYSTDNGSTWRLRTDGGTIDAPILITRASPEGTVLVDGVAYDVMIRAVNDVGTGLASNSVQATAVVPEILDAPSAANMSAGTAGPLAPVSIAGFTSDVTIDIGTTNGTVAVVGNAGLTSAPCSSCSGTSISFSGPQSAVNVALATLTATASAAGSGTVTIAVTKDGDSLPSLTAHIDLSVTAPRLSTPVAPTAHATSSSAVSVSFAAIANASSYTVRVYRSDGTTLVGAAHTSFTSGATITGLDPSTAYKFSVTAIGDGSTHTDSLQGPKGTATTPAAQVTPPTCGTPRPSQGLPSGAGRVYAVDHNGRLATMPSFDATHASLRRPIIGAVATSSAHGSWSLTSDGGIFTAGDAPYKGSLADRILNAPVSAIVGTPCAAGYDILANDGGVFAFGDAHFYGSMGGTKLNQPMAGIALTCSGKGYYTVANDGGVFTFGSATFRGSMASVKLVSPIIGITPNCSDTGYWMVASDGGVFTSGGVRFYGSLGGKHLASPIVSLIPSATLHGYWLVAANGTTYPFGDATR
jgi:hypothetical protein